MDEQQSFEGMPEPVEKPKRPRTPRQQVCDAIWDVLDEYFPVRTRGEQSRLGMVMREIMEIGGTPTETEIACRYVQRHFDPVTVIAVTHWWTKAQNDALDRKKPSMIEEYLEQWKNS